MSSAVTVRALASPELEGILDDLLPQEPELCYANFLPIASNAGAAHRLHRLQWRGSEHVIAAWVAHDANGRVLGATRALHRAFESDHFGIRAAKIELPLAVGDPEKRHAALRSLTAAAVADLSARGYQHVAARGSTRDRAAGWSYQENGFFHVDTQVSWMCPLTGTPHDEALSPGLHIEVHDRASLPKIEPRRWTKLADWAAEAFDRGPFVFDLSLPHERSKSIYRVWTERMMAGEWADAVLIVFHDDIAVAFISMLTLAHVSAVAGRHVCGRGLGATLPEYRGLFTAIQREMIARRPLGADFMENETQVSTIGSINVYAKLDFRYLRSTATYHRRLDGNGELR